MFRRRSIPVLTFPSAAAAGTTVLGLIEGISRFNTFSLDALLLGATGGTLDVYLQRLVDTNVWLDWARFTQLASGGAAIDYSIFFHPAASAPALTHVGQWGAAAVGGTPAGTQVITAGTVVPCHPGDQLRVVGVAGSGTSAGANQSFYLTGYEEYS